MAKVDVLVPYIEGEMIIAKKTISKEFPLKQGYTYQSFSNQFQQPMIEICKELKYSIDLESMIQNDRNTFKEHCILVCKDNEVVGFTGLYKDEEGCLFLAYLAVKESHQRQGIAKAMVTKICMQFDRIKGKFPLYAKVNAQSYIAIMLLARLEFTPFLGETKNKTEQESQEDWTKITEILRQKSKEDI